MLEIYLSLYLALEPRYKYTKKNKEKRVITIERKVKQRTDNKNEAKKIKKYI